MPVGGTPVASEAGEATVAESVMGVFADADPLDANAMDVAACVMEILYGVVDVLIA